MKKNILVLLILLLLTGCSNKQENNYISCYSFDQELEEGYEYTNGSYKYIYISSNEIDDYKGDEIYGWKVALTKDAKKEFAIDEQICSYVDDIPIISMEETFSKSKVNFVNLKDFDTSNVLSYRNMFSSSDIVEVDFSGFNIKADSVLENLFDDCLALKKIDISNTDFFADRMFNFLRTTDNRTRKLEVIVKNYEIYSLINEHYPVYEFNTYYIIK